jgi:hypothetical protein
VLAQGVGPVRPHLRTVTIETSNGETGNELQDSDYDLTQSGRTDVRSNSFTLGHSAGYDILVSELLRRHWGLGRI